MEDPKSNKQTDFWNQMMTKYRQRNMQLEEQQCTLRHRLEAMECTLPAALMYKMNGRNAAGNQIDVTQFMMQLGRPFGDTVTTTSSLLSTCPCNPCLARPSNVQAQFVNALSLASGMDSKPSSIGSGSCTCSAEPKQPSIGSDCTCCSCNPCEGSAQQSMGSRDSCPCGPCNAKQPSTKSDTSSGGSCSCDPCEGPQPSLGSDGSDGTCPCDPCEGPQPSVGSDGTCSCDSCPDKGGASVAASDQCTCNPCLARQDSSVTENGSLFSLQSADLLCMTRLNDMVNREKEMKRQIQELEHREQAYMETLKKADEMWANVEGTYGPPPPSMPHSGDNVTAKFEKITEQLMEENGRLTDELKDARLELKQCMERVQGPICRQLEKERRKSEQLESQLLSSSKTIAGRETSFMRDMNNMQCQLDCTCRNLCDLNAANEQLKKELCLMQCKYGQLQQDLINQKISEAHTLERLNEAICAEKVAAGDATAKRRDSDEDDTLGGLARRLSGTLVDIDKCDECRTLPGDLKETVKGIRDVADIVDQGGKSKKRRPSKRDECEEDESDREGPKKRRRDSRDQPTSTTSIHSALDVSVQSGGKSLSVETETEVSVRSPSSRVSGALSREPSGKLSRESSVSRRASERASEGSSAKASGRSSRRSSATGSRRESGTVSTVPSSKSKGDSRVSIHEPSEKEASRISSKSTVSQALESYKESLASLGISGEEVEIITEVEAAGDVEVEVETEVNLYETVSDGINITTTITGSGTLEVITEGPAGVIETIMTYTESGNIDITTEITEYPTEAVRKPPPIMEDLSRPRTSVSSVSKIAISEAPSSVSRLTPSASEKLSRGSRVSFTATESETSKASTATEAEGLTTTEASDIETEPATTEVSDTEGEEGPTTADVSEGEEGPTTAEASEAEGAAETAEASEAEEGAETAEASEAKEGAETAEASEAEEGAPTAEASEAEEGPETGEVSEAEEGPTTADVSEAEEGPGAGEVSEAEEAPTTAEVSEGEEEAETAAVSEAENAPEVAEAAPAEPEEALAEAEEAAEEAPEVSEVAPEASEAEAAPEAAEEAGEVSEATPEVPEAEAEPVEVPETVITVEVEGAAEVTEAEEAPAEEVPTEEAPETPAEGGAVPEFEEAAESLPAGSVVSEPEVFTQAASEISTALTPTEIEVQIELDEEGELQPIEIEAIIVPPEEGAAEAEEGIPLRHESISEEPFVLACDNLDDLRKGVTDAMLKANKDVMDALDQANKNVTDALEKANKDVETALTAAVKESQSRANKQAFTEEEAEVVPEAKPSTAESTAPEVFTSATAIPEGPASATPGVAETVSEVPSGVSEAPTVPSTTAEVPTVPSSESEVPTVPSAASEVPTVPSAASEVPTVPSAASEVPTVPSAASEVPTVPSAASEVPSAVSEPSTMGETISEAPTMPEVPSTVISIKEEIYVSAPSIPQDESHADSEASGATPKEEAYWEGLGVGKKPSIPLSTPERCKDVCSPSYKQEEVQVCTDICGDEARRRLSEAGARPSAASTEPSVSERLSEGSETITQPSIAEERSAVSAGSEEEEEASVSTAQKLSIISEGGVEADVEVETAVSVEVGGTGEAEAEESGSRRSSRIPSPTTPTTPRDSRTPSTKSPSRKSSEAPSKRSSRKESVTSAEEAERPPSKRSSKSGERKSRRSSDKGRVSSRELKTIKSKEGRRSSGEAGSRSPSKIPVAVKRPSKLAGITCDCGECDCEICSPEMMRAKEERLRAERAARGQPGDCTCSPDCGCAVCAKPSKSTARSQSLLSRSKISQLLRSQSAARSQSATIRKCPPDCDCLECLCDPCGDFPEDYETREHPPDCDCLLCLCDPCGDIDEPCGSSRRSSAARGPSREPSKALSRESARRSQDAPRSSVRILPTESSSRRLDVCKSKESSRRMSVCKSTESSRKMSVCKSTESARRMSAGKKPSKSRSSALQDHIEGCDCLVCRCCRCSEHSRAQGSQKPSLQSLPSRKGSVQRKFPPKECTCPECLCLQGSPPSQSTVPAVSSRATSGSKKSDRIPSIKSGRGAKASVVSASKSSVKDPSIYLAETHEILAPQSSFSQTQQSNRISVAGQSFTSVPAADVEIEIIVSPEESQLEVPEEQEPPHPPDCDCIDCLTAAGPASPPKRDSEEMRHPSNCSCLECSLIRDIAPAPAPAPDLKAPSKERSIPTGIKKMEDEALIARIKELENEAQQRFKEMDELRDVMRKIKCSCREAEVTAKKCGPSQRSLLAQKRSSYRAEMSEARVNLDALQAKCRQKDRMIAVMTEELKLRGNSKVFDSMLQKLATMRSSQDVVDFDRREICNSLPRPICDPKYGRPSNQLREPMVCQPCNHPDYPNCPCKGGELFPIEEEVRPVQIPEGPRHSSDCNCPDCSEKCGTTCPYLPKEGERIAEVEEEAEPQAEIEEKMEAQAEVEEKPQPPPPPRPIPKCYQTPEKKAQLPDSKLGPSPFASATKLKKPKAPCLVHPPGLRPKVPVEISRKPVQLEPCPRPDGTCPCPRTKAPPTLEPCPRADGSCPCPKSKAEQKGDSVAAQKKYPCTKHKSKPRIPEGKPGQTKAGDVPCTCHVCPILQKDKTKDLSLPETCEVPQKVAQQEPAQEKVEPRQEEGTTHGPNCNCMDCAQICGASCSGDPQLSEMEIKKTDLAETEHGEGCDCFDCLNKCGDVCPKPDMLPKGSPHDPGCECEECALVCGPTCPNIAAPKPQEEEIVEAAPTPEPLPAVVVEEPPSEKKSSLAKPPETQIEGCTCIQCFEKPKPSPPAPPEPEADQLHGEGCECFDCERNCGVACEKEDAPSKRRASGKPHGEGCQCLECRKICGSTCELKEPQEAAVPDHLEGCTCIQCVERPPEPQVREPEHGPDCDCPKCADICGVSCPRLPQPPPQKEPSEHGPECDCADCRQICGEVCPVRPAEKQPSWHGPDCNCIDCLRLCGEVCPRRPTEQSLNVSSWHGPDCNCPDCSAVCTPCPHPSKQKQRPCTGMDEKSGPRKKYSAQLDRRGSTGSRQKPPCIVMPMPDLKRGYGKPKPCPCPEGDPSGRQGSQGGPIDSSPLEVTEVRRITADSLIIKWNAPATKHVTGYEVLVDGIIKSRVHSSNRTSAIVHSLEMKPSLNITVYALSRVGRCQPPASALFQT